jgi:hypothetical protein
MEVAQTNKTKTKTTMIPSGFYTPEERIAEKYEEYLLERRHRHVPTRF